MYALNDLLLTLKGFNRWAYVGVKRLQLEYRRALVGSLWIILGFGLSSLGIALVLAALLDRPLIEHVPYVAFGLAFWNFMNNAILSGCSVFTSNRAFLLQSTTPRGGFALILLVRISAVLAANISTATAIAFAFGWMPSLNALGTLLSLPFLLITSYGVIIGLGYICARVPDIGELVASVMRLAFFLTPVIWTLDQRAARLQLGADPSILNIVYTYNPFTYFLNISRGPLIGYTPTAQDWLVTVSLTSLLLLFGMIITQLFGRRVVFWV